MLPKPPARQPSSWPARRDPETRHRSVDIGGRAMSISEAGQCRHRKQGSVASRSKAVSTSEGGQWRHRRHGSVDIRGRAVSTSQAWQCRHRRHGNSLSSSGIAWIILRTVSNACTYRRPGHALTSVRETFLVARRHGRVNIGGMLLSTLEAWKLFSLFLDCELALSHAGVAESTPEACHCRHRTHATVDIGGMPLLTSEACKLSSLFLHCIDNSESGQQCLYMSEAWSCSYLCQRNLLGRTQAWQSQHQRHATVDIRGVLTNVNTVVRYWRAELSYGAQNLAMSGSSAHVWTRSRKREESLRACNVSTAIPTISTVPCLRETRQVQRIKHASDVDSSMPPMSTLPCLRVTKQVPLTENYQHNAGRRKRVSMPPMSTVACLRCRQWHASDVDSGMPLVSTLPCLYESKQVPLTEREESFHASDVDSSMPPVSTLPRLRESKQVPLTEREESFHASDIDSSMPPILTLPCLHATKKVSLTENYPRNPGRGRRVSMPAMSTLPCLRCRYCPPSDIDTAVPTMSLPPALRCRHCLASDGDTALLPMSTLPCLRCLHFCASSLDQHVLAKS
ncbi:hypothetical protein EV426DRAFT_700787 [Tirmania nivea]|nr:hypothetical protein EV426DRAFT_700787 [Tirmania nivea]